ncbi:FSR family fosmidomycin resistance protein-like MFS transporter [Afipia massiliensis]|uniref:FSR family fosmidomycin resistance protein-like MFS transporter n=1 Tax=Afipia massiliensis TaxID=211460 RepID=A0A840NCY4_9BRAD|nr:FSR family fosmidomycin resistance protein-like MFS transporter [Afipia massiliensis]
MNKPVILSEDTLVAPIVVDAPATPAPAAPAFAVIGAISFSHLLNDLMQSLIPSVYPILKDNYALDFGQIGMITLAFMFTSSLLQPLIGAYTDKYPKPFSLALGMGFTFAGLILLSVAHHYWVILLAAGLVGTGSAVFHPESSRIARMASGGRVGMAQSVFQVGGNLGTAIGPVLAALIIVPFGQGSIAWFSLVAALAIVVLWQIGRWYQPRIAHRKGAHTSLPEDGPSSTRTMVALTVLMVLLFSKTFYTASIGSYYTFFLMQKFGVSTQASQIYLFLFLGASAVGVFFGGPLGDRFGRKYVIWFSIIGALPFTLALPYVGLYWNAVLSIVIGFIISSATPAIIVYAQELMPHRLGMISGLFYGMAFGFGGIGAAVLGQVADWKDINFVYQVCAFLPAIGLLAIFLPQMKHRKL